MSGAERQAPRSGGRPIVKGAQATASGTRQAHKQRRIDEIRIGHRHRRDLGDVESLAASIAEVGLLHPIVVTPAGDLVAGRRRLAACQSLGFYTRSNVERVLLATRGSPKRLAMDVHQIVIAPVAEHSAKPDEVYRRIDRLFPGPRLELFARRPREGWTCWGDELPREHLAPTRRAARQTHP